MEYEAHHGKDEAEDEGPAEALDMEAGNDGARQEDEKGVEHEDEEPEGDNR